MNQSIKFANNATVRLAKDLRIGEKKIYVNAGDTSYFPSIEKLGDFFILCLVNNTTGAFEIVKCTSVESDSFIVERAQEETTEKFFPAGSLVENRLTAGSIQNIFNFTKASKDDAGLVFVGDYDDLVNGNPDKSPIVPTIDAVKDYVNDFGFISGGIVAFSGKFISGYPVPYGKEEPNKNWHICDGTNGTPDLNDRFIQGTSDVDTIGTIGGDNILSGTTGPCTLTVEEIPSHQHYGATAGGYLLKPASEWGPWLQEGWTSKTGGNMSHTHAFNTSTDNRPAFYTLAYIMKIK